jgi:hypothetical protein
LDLEIIVARHISQHYCKGVRFINLNAPRLRRNHLLTRYNLNLLGRYALSRHNGPKNEQEPDATCEEEGAEEGATGSF